MTRGLESIRIEPYVAPLAAGRGSIYPADHAANLFTCPVKNVLLINPLQIPSDYFDIDVARRKRYFCYPPYGLGLLASSLRGNEFVVEILDINFLVLQRAHDSDSLEASFIDGLIEDTIQRFRPDCIGVTCMFTLTHDSFKRTIDYVKAQHPSIPIVVGGVHVTNDPKRIRQEIPDIDLILPNESEFYFTQLLIDVNNNLNALSEKKPSYFKAPVTAIPSFSDLNLGKYSSVGEVGAYRFLWKEHTSAATVQSNRGCRAKCTFCSVENFNGKGVRTRDIHEVVEEIAHYRECYGINHIMWLDDDLFFDKDRALSLFYEIIRQRLNITWDASNGIIASAASEELIAASKESGCIGMHVGIESGSERILKSIRKPSGIKHFLRLGEIFDKYPEIFTKGFLITGFPNETVSEMKATISLAQEMNLDWYTISVLTPLPSTKIFDQMVELGLIDQQRLKSKEVNFGSMQTGTQKRYEESRKNNAVGLIKLEDFADSMIVPREELEAIWFDVDYSINYANLLNVSERRVEKTLLFLRDINTRMTQNSNPISLYYEGMLRKRNGQHDFAEDLLRTAKHVLSESAIWRARFEYLNLSL